jgi:hypothetical protein
MTAKHYPDLSDIFARRDAGRKQRARMSMGEKLKVMDKLRATADEFKEMRERRKSAPSRQKD